MSDFETVNLERDAGVATITLNRPDALNALDLQLGADLRDALRACAADRDVRAVVLTGAGKAFCAGGDVTMFKERKENAPPFLEDLVMYLHDCIGFMTRMEKPIVTAVNGVAAGAGMSIALMADLVIASERARFTLAYTNIGLSPDGGSTFVLARLVGVRRAMELALENPVLSAQDALAWGLVNRTAAPDELASAAAETAARLAAGPTRAFAVAKQLLWKSAETPLWAQLDDEARGIVRMGGTEDFKEGVTAFADKRKPTFRGE